MSNSSEYYDHHVKELNAQYLAIKTEDVHRSWLSLIGNSGSALDVGTGVGRDAAFLCKKGYIVTATDPSPKMIQQAQANFPELPIIWIQDKLPDLKKIRTTGKKFDLILISAVWQHIAPSHREKSLRILSSLLAPNGRIIITLRHGDFSDERVSFDVSSSEISNYAKKFGLSFHLPNGETLEVDQINRAKVAWQTAVLTLPDDGSGAFPLLRNIVINDSKAATYKMALIRSILRIAEGHIGAAIKGESTSKNVALPLGLIAMYWLKLFKPLLDNKMPQNSNLKKGLGFVKENGWNTLGSFSNNDFFIGAIHTQNTKSLHSTLLHITSTIKSMPAKYIKLPNTDTAVFEVDRQSPKAPKTALVLNYDYLRSFGLFYVPREIWNTLSQYSCWIEPALVNEWIRIMRSFESQSSRIFSLDEYQSALEWEEQTRSTDKVRKRVNELKQQQDVVCTWSKHKLSKQYDIDHTFPFMRWPNNDLWNLVPSKSKLNRQKSDKLVTSARLIHAKPQILDFWEKAWGNEKTTFFSQANLSLPDLAIDNCEFESVFESMLMQRRRIKETQQLADW